MRVKTDFQQLDEKPYITPGKEYEVVKVHESGLGFSVRSDTGAERFCLFKGCAHLDGRDWEVINDAE